MQRTPRVAQPRFNSRFCFAAPEEQGTMGSVANPDPGRDEAFSRYRRESINVNEISV
jgi:hypothetical protein